MSTFSRSSSVDLNYIAYKNALVILQISKYIRAVSEVYDFRYTVHY